MSGKDKPAEENLFRKGAYQSAVLFALTTGGNLCGYFTRAALSRILSTADFGLFYSILSLFGFLFIFVSLGFGQALIKHIAQYSALKKYRELYSSIGLVGLVMLLSGTIVSLALYFSAPMLSSLYFRTPEALIPLRLFSVLILVNVAVSLMSSVFCGFRRMGWAGLMYFAMKFGFLLCVLGLTFFAGLSGVLLPVYAILISYFSFMPFVFPLRRLFKNFKGFEFSAGLFRRLAAFAFPALLNSLGFMVIGQIDVLLLTYMLSDLGQVGIYNAVLPTAVVLTYLTSTIGTVFFPVASELWAKGAKRRLAEGVRLVYNYVFYIVIPFAIVLSIYPDLILGVLFGEAYRAGASALQILAFGVVMASMFSVNGSLISGMGRPGLVTKILLPASLLNIVLNVLLIPLDGAFGGLNGAAIATFVSYLVMMVASVHFIKRLTGVKLPWSGWTKIGVCGLFFAGTIIILKLALSLPPFFEAAISVSAGFGVYLGLGYLGGILRIEHLRQLWPLKK
jgi:stage V sporulation protein B